MRNRSCKGRHFLPVAFVILSAAVFGTAQQPPVNKHNTRPEVSAQVSAPLTENEEVPASYSYEFVKPEFYVKHILIEHDANGRGRISFVKRDEETPVVEPLEFSQATVSRISALWKALRFLESNEDYQSARQYPHMGTMRLRMEQASRKRMAEFNWTNHKEASLLVDEYRRIGDQAMLIFDISVARESQPLNAPKLMEHLETLFRRNALSDPRQLLPLLKEISTDEYLPLIARNHALRLIKKIDK